ncbi:tRNA-splicing endonuclease subunit, partial [Coemansia aciculifera]
MIFDPDTVLRLRRDHRIVGALEGSHPTNPQQNNYYGLPLVLLPEETALLHKEQQQQQQSTPPAWPQTDQEKLRFALYCALHARGFYITRAIKFGADYMLYPGDPMRYHS